MFADSRIPVTVIDGAWVAVVAVVGARERSAALRSLQVDEDTPQGLEAVPDRAGVAVVASFLKTTAATACSADITHRAGITIVAGGSFRAVGPGRRGVSWRGAGLGRVVRRRGDQLDAGGGVALALEIIEEAVEIVTPLHTARAPDRK